MGVFDVTLAILTVIYSAEQRLINEETHYEYQASI
jgi:hypothetical protein